MWIWQVSWIGGGRKVLLVPKLHILWPFVSLLLSAPHHQVSWMLMLMPWWYSTVLMSYFRHVQLLLLHLTAHSGDGVLCVLRFCRAYSTWRRLFPVFLLAFSFLDILQKQCIRQASTGAWRQMAFLFFDGTISTLVFFSPIGGQTSKKVNDLVLMYFDGS